MPNNIAYIKNYTTILDAVYNTFLTSNEWQWRLARTAPQGLIGVLVANVDMIVGFAVVDPSIKALAVLSPVMAELGKHLPEPKGD